VIEPEADISFHRNGKDQSGAVIMDGDEISLVDSPRHFKACHKRWMERRNRRAEAKDYRDMWLEEQCMFCRYFVPLTGVFGEDYGACSNAQSPSDGMVRFEHDGCSEFAQGEWWAATDREA